MEVTESFRPPEKGLHMYHIGLVGFVLVLLCSPVRADDGSALRDALALEEALQTVIQQVEPAIACVLVARTEAGIVHLRDAGTSRRSPTNDADSVPEGYGSGVVIDGPKGLVLTNYHVIRDALRIMVRLPGDRPSDSRDAKIYAADSRSDLAVLRLTGGDLTGLKEVRFGDGGAVRKGQFIVALANPFAVGSRDGSPSASFGIISNIRRRAAPDVTEAARLQALHRYGTLLQTDARMSIGCSGGGLFNLKGEMIGLTTSRAALTGSETAGGFALPLDAATKRIIDKLRQGKEVEYGFLGIIPKDAPPGEGVEISSVTNGTPAARAHLQAGERILSINGIRMETTDDLFLTVGTLLAGTEARLEIKNRRDVVPVRLVKSYVPGKVEMTNRPPAIRGCRVDYTSVLWLQTDYALRPLGVNYYPIPRGVYVCEVEPGSPAEAAGLKKNTIITQVNGQRIETPEEFYREAARPGLREELRLALTDADGRQGTSELIIH
jgi:S1-C subfamily serine protease